MDNVAFIKMILVLHFVNSSSMTRFLIKADKSIFIVQSAVSLVIYYSIIILILPTSLILYFCIDSFFSPFRNFIVFDTRQNCQHIDSNY